MERIKKDRQVYKTIQVREDIKEQLENLKSEAKSPHISFQDVLENLILFYRRNK